MKIYYVPNVFFKFTSFVNFELFPSFCLFLTPYVNSVTHLPLNVEIYKYKKFFIFLDFGYWIRTWSFLIFFCFVLFHSDYIHLFLLLFLLSSLVFLNRPSLKRLNRPRYRSYQNLYRVPSLKYKTQTYIRIQYTSSMVLDLTYFTE